MPQEAAASQEFAKLLDAWDAAAVEARKLSAAARDARSREVRAFERMKQYVAGHPEVETAAAEAMQRWAGQRDLDGAARPPVDPMLDVLFGRDAGLREQYLRQSPDDDLAQIEVDLAASKGNGEDRG